VALLLPELEAGAVAAEPLVVEPELFVELELLVPDPEPVVADPPEVAPADEEWWLAEVPLVLTVEFVEPGSSNATIPPAATPARPMAAVTARSRDLAWSRAATARATSRCWLVITAPLTHR
jgi:hypothetical protein